MTREDESLQSREQMLRDLTDAPQSDEDERYLAERAAAQRRRIDLSMARKLAGYSVASSERDRALMGGDDVVVIPAGSLCPKRW